MADTITAVLDAPDVIERVPGRKTGKAPLIRKLAINNPELTHSEIARAVGCDPSNVTGVLKTFLGKTTDTDLRSYQENQADIFDSLAHRLLSSLTEEKIEKSKPMEAIIGACALIDKARLVRGQATGINVSVLMDVAQAIRERRRNPQGIGAASAGDLMADVTHKG